jgi:hypothetical protein
MSKKEKDRRSRRTMAYQDTGGVNLERTMKDLQEDYEKLLQLVEDGGYEKFTDLIVSSDIKYFLVHNDLDYNLFKKSLKFQRIEYIT